MLFQAYPQHRAHHVLRQLVGIAHSRLGALGSEFPHAQEVLTVCHPSGLHVEALAASFSLGSATAAVSSAAEKGSYLQHPQTPDKLGSSSVLYLPGQGYILNRICQVPH